jgi:signal transduction histidine kinase
MSSVRGLAAWGRRTLRHRAALIDAIAAATLTGGALWSAATLRADHWVPVTIAAAAACTVTVGWRRRAPALAALVALTALTVYQLAGHDTQGAFVTAAIVLTCYSVGRLGAAGPRRRVLLAVLGYALAACLVIDLDSGFSAVGVLLTWLPVAVLPAAAGLIVERRERTMHDLLVAESRLCDEHSIRTARLLAEERTRVARELHDVVAHCVSVMVIQAGAARLVLDTDAAAAGQALSAVLASGRDALADLRRVVGVLRRSDDSCAGPARGLAQLDRLSAGVRSGGLRVRCRIEGEPVALPAEVDLAAFRIVQEALTNVLKHAHSARVEVVVAYRAHSVEVRVEDTGPADPVTTTAGSGRGLVGMAERVAMHGGELHAGPTAAGGFTVTRDCRCPRRPWLPRSRQPRRRRRVAIAFGADRGWTRCWPVVGWWLWRSRHSPVPIEPVRWPSVPARSR